MKSQLAPPQAVGVGHGRFSAFIVIDFFILCHKYCANFSSQAAKRQCSKIVIPIDNILLDESILQQPFLCDLKKCKGACCTVEGGDGAPLLDEEIPAIRQAIPAVLPLLNSEVRQIVEQQDFYEGKEGDWATRCIDDKDCVFVVYEGAVAKCALEKAYFNGQTEFRKPISCHLFPIRVADFGGDYLYFERTSECQPAFDNGKDNDVHLFEMTREGLERLYGTEWYARLLEFAARGLKTSAGRKEQV